MLALSLIHPTAAPGVPAPAALGNVPPTGSSIFRAVVSGAIARPDGHVDSVRAVVGGIRASGWSADRSRPLAEVPVDLRIGSSAPVRLAAITPHPDLVRAHPDYGPAHGWSFVQRVPTGSYDVCVTTVTRPARTLGCQQVDVAPVDYTALGDSYTSETRLADAPYTNADCFQSSANYPHLTAHALGLRLSDASCAGALTAHLTTPQTSHHNPPQETQLSATTRIVSVLYGFNDIGFGEIIGFKCPSTSPTGPSRSGFEACRDYYQQGGTDTLLDRVARFRASFASALVEIRAKAPNATVFVMSYEAPWSPTAADCWSPLYPVQDSDTRYLASVQRALVDVLAQDAAQAGAHFVDLYDDAVKHTPCAAPDARWVAPYGPGPYMHPTNLGHVEAATRLEAALRQYVLLH